MKKKKPATKVPDRYKQHLLYMGARTRIENMPKDIADELEWLDQVIAEVRAKLKLKR